MKKVTYTCDSCGKEDNVPMAIFRNGDKLEWRLNADPDKADFHTCSRECAKKLTEPEIRQTTEF